MHLNMQPSCLPGRAPPPCCACCACCPCCGARRPQPAAGSGTVFQLAVQSTWRGTQRLHRCTVLMACGLLRMSQGRVCSSWSLCQLTPLPHSRHPRSCLHTHLQALHPGPHSNSCDRHSLGVALHGLPEHGNLRTGKLGRVWGAHSGQVVQPGATATLHWQSPTASQQQERRLEFLEFTGRSPFTLLPVSSGTPSSSAHPTQYFSSKAPLTSLSVSSGRLSYATRAHSPLQSMLGGGRVLTRNWLNSWGRTWQAAQNTCSSR